MSPAHRWGHRWQVSSHPSGASPASTNKLQLCSSSFSQEQSYPTPKTPPLWEHPTLEGKQRTRLQHRDLPVYWDNFPKYTNKTALPWKESTGDFYKQVCWYKLSLPIRLLPHLSSALLQGTVSEVCWQTCSSEGSRSLLQSGPPIPPANPCHFDSIRLENMV